MVALELIGGGLCLEENCVFVDLYLRIQNIAVVKYFDKCLLYFDNFTRR